MHFVSSYVEVEIAPNETRRHSLKMKEMICLRVCVYYVRRHDVRAFKRSFLAVSSSSNFSILSNNVIFKIKTEDIDLLFR